MAAPPVISVVTPIPGRRPLEISDAAGGLNLGASGDVFVRPAASFFVGAGSTAGATDLSTVLSLSFPLALDLPNKLEPAEVGSLLLAELLLGVAEEEFCLVALGRGSALWDLLSPADDLEGPLCNMREAMVWLCKVLACGCDHAGPERANRSASGTLCVRTGQLERRTAGICLDIAVRNVRSCGSRSLSDAWGAGIRRGGG